jgi:hypothetical protein
MPSVTPPRLLSYLPNTPYLASILVNDDNRVSRYHLVVDLTLCRLNECW